MKPEVIELYNDYIHGDMPRRTFLRRLAEIAGGAAGVLVIHENRGLNAHIEDVARRAADTDTITADVIKGIGYLKSRDDCTGKVGSVGFCYGGGVSLQCAVATPAADASVLFYGRALSAEQVAQVKVPLMMNYAGNDPRVNAMIPDFRKALDVHHVAYSLHMYPGTGHGFHNDTSQARYNEEAAGLAWNRTVNFFNHYLN